MSFPLEYAYEEHVGDVPKPVEKERRVLVKS